MLMDEAFSALDPLIRRDMQDQLIELQQELGKTILFITHDLNEAMRLGDRIAMMRDGRIEQIGTAQEILNDPVNRYVADFVQDVDRSRVLTASDIMTSVDGDAGPPEGAVVPADATLADLFAEATEHEQLLVQDASGQTVGTIRRTDLLAALHTGPGEGAGTSETTTTGDLQPTGGVA
ncbi:hypothetical protein BJF82_16575 [Kytococcus sp. CUA-901]|nr:hypothetical protein BJF82_16575 [Kytococcus sp. CUA-901]